MFRNTLLIIFVLTLAFSFVGCDDDNDITGQEEHFDAVGIIIQQSGVIVLDYYGPDYQAGDDIAYLDTLQLSLGLNPHWKAYFYDEDGEQIDPPLTPDEGGHQTFAATFTSELAELWWHEGEDGAFEFHIRGLESGSCTVEFNVMHEGHSDFTTLPIPVVVGTEVLHDEPVGVRLYDEETEQLLATAWLAATDSTEGSLSVSANDSTDHIEALFFDTNDIEFFPPVPPHSLVVESSDTNIVTIVGQVEDEPWAFKLYGNSAGSATITVYLYHDDEIGKTFTPVDITVQ